MKLFIFFIALSLIPGTVPAQNTQVDLVNLRFISEYHKLAPDTVIKMRSEGMNFVNINVEIEKGKGKSKRKQGNVKKKKKDKPRKMKD
jgi:hypothetical protein